ncbi:MAG: hypothetical protein K2W95_06815 [Candidatus Obscuribacterales bacterium]|nr:hypothetical protein [Candidatus Obscuribacterales bacterium]
MNVRIVDDVTDLEVKLLMTCLYERYGLDFSQYSSELLRRRLLLFAENNGLRSISLIQDRVLHEPEWLDKLLCIITVSATPMFRAPSFFHCLREKVIPALKTDPYFRIWIAGCSGGEEAYLLAVLLEDEGVYDRCRVYATDVSEESINIAKRGVYAPVTMSEYGSIYAESGGSKRLSEHYSLVNNEAVMHPNLRRNIVFARHNIATDSSFNDFSLILCRNSMVHFQKPLRDRVFSLLHESLTFYGLLAVGNKESIRISPLEKYYQEFDPEHRIYRKMGQGS